MKNIIVALVLVLVASSCQKDEFEITNLNNNQISILGHGGMGIGQTYPMNSFESIQRCLSHGADGTEIDVQMTKDSVLVAFHDRFLEQASNATGRIFEKNWSELSNAVYKDPPYTNYRLITLDQLFSNIKNPTNYTFFLDCKNFDPDRSSAYLNRFNNALIKIIDKHNLANNVYIEFKQTELIRSLRNKRPDLAIFVYGEFESALATVNKFELEGIAVSVDRISKEQVKQAHNNGTMVTVFNAHSKDRNIEAIEKNVDFIQSDKVKHLIRILR